MKKALLLSVVASTMIMAGGDIAPVEPVIETPVVIEEDTGAFYLGLGYGYFDAELTSNIGLQQENAEADMDTILFQAGYEFNQYVAIEGRYWLGVSDLDDAEGDYSTWGIYVKPQYPVSEAFNIYALLGYASTTLEPDNAAIEYLDTDSFSWGIGAEYKFTENVSLFLDYTDLGETDEFTFNGVDLSTNSIEATIYTVNFGLTYRF